MAIKAKLTIIFCTFNNNPIFDRFTLNEKEYKIENGIIEKELTFNKYENDLGKKICCYKLKTKEENNASCEGTFEISQGNNIAYCFLDDGGITFKILFLQKKESIKEFINSKFTINNIYNIKNEIELSLNQNETEDRANLILINCLTNTEIKKEGQLLINLREVVGESEFSEKNVGYQICYHYGNYIDYAYQKMEEVDQLNFKNLYDSNLDQVEEMYKILNTIMDNKDKTKTKELINNFFKKYKEKRYELTNNIIQRKYLYSNKILEEELNSGNYFDFIFKILSLILFEEKYSEGDEKNNYGINDFKIIYNKLIENKKKLESDNLLKIYEKIFLLIDVYTSEFIYMDNKEDYIINYLHINNFEAESPLLYAYAFLYDFIKDLDYNSNFYYPLLSIDSGLYEYFFKEYKKYISTFGFNMLSLDKIKDHLKDMIPSYIIISKKLLKDDENARTNPLNGNIILNINQFGFINIDKNQPDENISKHYAFIISKILIHEFFGHKKSSFSKIGKNYNSIISFKDESGERKYIDDNDKKKIKDGKDIMKDKNINLDSFRGDSGYFIEFFLEKINNEYTNAIIDTIENKTNLCKLLDAKLWHRELNIFKEYLKLKSIFLDYFPDHIIENNLNIYEQIKLMKEKIDKEKIKIEDKQSNKNEEVKNNLETKIDKMFDVVWKKRKNIKIKKGLDKTNSKKEEKKEFRNKFREEFFAEFTHGFYRK